MADKYTKSAQGQCCQIRIPGVCNHDNATVVFCHINGGGMGMKHLSIHGAYGCTACHDVVDGRKDVGLHTDLLRLYHLDGVIRTQQLMVDQRLLKL